MLRGIKCIHLSVLSLNFDFMQTTEMWLNYPTPHTAIANPVCKSFGKGRQTLGEGSFFVHVQQQIPTTLCHYPMLSTTKAAVRIRDEEGNDNLLDGCVYSPRSLLIWFSDDIWVTIYSIRSIKWSLATSVHPAFAGPNFMLPSKCILPFTVLKTIDLACNRQLGTASSSSSYFW